MHACNEPLCWYLDAQSYGPMRRRRLVTAIWYLNVGWREAHGGKVVMQPGSAEEVAVAPAADTVVVFNSSLPHAVTQSNVDERWALTMWVHEKH